MITRRLLFKLLAAVGLTAALPKLPLADEPGYPCLVNDTGGPWFTLPKLPDFEPIPGLVGKPHINVAGRVLSAIEPELTSSYARAPVGLIRNIVGRAPAMVDSDGSNQLWLPCDGRSLRAVDYPELFKVIGHTYG